MNDNFSIDSNLEVIINKIEKDNSILDSLSDEELKYINDYLDNKIDYLNSVIGGQNGV